MSDQEALFEHIQKAPADAVFAVNEACNNDPSEKKVNLTVGAYRDGNGKPVVFDAVRIAGERIYAPGNKYNKEYLPMAGMPSFISCAQTLCFGADSAALKEGRIASVQALSGTGALSLVAGFLKKTFPSEAQVLVSNPTWPNHNCIFQELYDFNVRPYRYWDVSMTGFNLADMLEDLSAAPMKSIVILHACAHNPTGEDPTHEDWHQILEVVRRKRHFAILDSAYQGFATKDLDRDAYSIRLFEKSGLEYAVCQSFAKNMGLYGERVGAAHIVCKSAAEAKVVWGRLQRLCRLLWSNPPRHGAEIAHIVLTDPELRAMWITQLAEVSQRLQDMRKALRDALEKLGTPGSWSHITKQIGMFSYTGLTTDQVIWCREKHHVYFMSSGRISVAGVNPHNVDYIAKAFDDAVRNCP